MARKYLPLALQSQRLVLRFAAPIASILLLFGRGQEMTNTTVYEKTVR